jgi:hypothetical protein
VGKLVTVMIYVLKKIPEELRRLAVVGVVAGIVTTAVIYSRAEHVTSEDPQHGSKQPFQQPKDRPQAEGWFTPTPRPETSDDKAAEIANATPLPQSRPRTPGFYYELTREQGDGEGNYVLIERQCIPKVDMPEPCYLPERGRQNFPLRRE